MKDAPPRNFARLHSHWLLMADTIYGANLNSMYSYVEANNQRNFSHGFYRGSGWHGDSWIERLACLQHAEAEDQELAHCRHNDLLGLETTRTFEARDEGRNGRIEAHRGQRRHVKRRP